MNITVINGDTVTLQTGTPEPAHQVTVEAPLQHSIVVSSTPPAANGIPSGGAAGTILGKVSAADFDAGWITTITAPIIIDGGLL